jgi:hypothetical protein
MEESKIYLKYLAFDHLININGKDHLPWQVFTFLLRIIFQEVASATV